MKSIIILAIVGLSAISCTFMETKVFDISNLFKI